MLNALRYLARSGCGWRMLPKDFLSWLTVYWWFRRFVRRLLCRTIHDMALRLNREREAREQNPSAAVVDSESVKAPLSPSGGGYDAGKRIKGCKRHIAVDTDDRLQSQPAGAGFESAPRPSRPGAALKLCLPEAPRGVTRPRLPQNRRSSLQHLLLKERIRQGKRFPFTGRHRPALGDHAGAIIGHQKPLNRPGRSHRRACRYLPHRRVRSGHHGFRYRDSGRRNLFAAPPDPIRCC